MDFENLHQILRSLYDEMMPLCSDMTDIAKGLAGLGALFYVALRVWQSLSRAEPIDVFPLLRPFAIGLAIMFFPTIVLGTLNSVMSPIVQGTHSMLETQTFDMNEYRAQKDKHLIQKRTVSILFQTKRSINYHMSHQNSCVLMPNDKPKTSQKPAEPLR